MKAVRLFNWILLAVCVFFTLAIPALGVGSAAANWNGSCFGFTDSQWPCPFWEFAGNQMFWASIFILPRLAMTMAVWLSVNIIQWAVRAYQRGTPSSPV